jgi:hypothetical protein
MTHERNVETGTPASQPASAKGYAGTSSGGRPAEISPKMLTKASSSGADRMSSRNVGRNDRDWQLDVIVADQDRIVPAPFSTDARVPRKSSMPVTSSLLFEFQAADGSRRAS